MGSSSQASAKTANRRVSDLSADRESRLPGFSATNLVMRVAQSLWPTKPDQALAHKTGRSDRLCRYWLEEKYNLSANDLVALLRSDEGLHILDGIMGDSKPVWWAGFKRGVKRAELRRQQKLIQKALDEDEQGEMGI
jgi:hypothetical protein